MLLLATANAAKARELAALLTGVPYRLRTLADFPGVTLPPEGADSYVENALAKARAAAADWVRRHGARAADGLRSGRLMVLCPHQLRHPGQGTGEDRGAALDVLIRDGIIEPLKLTGTR